MLAFRTTGRFEKEFRLAVRRGKDVSKLQAVMRALVQEVPLDPRLRDHALKGEFSGRAEGDKQCYPHPASPEHFEDRARRPKSPAKGPRKILVTIWSQTQRKRGHGFP